MGVPIEIALPGDSPGDALALVVPGASASGGTGFGIWPTAELAHSTVT